MKIAVLAVYFGNLPIFAQLFLASCEKNKSIDFLLIGDAWCTVEGNVPSNCHVLAISLEKFKTLAQKNTGFKPDFSSPYKVCDYKPALGEVFQAELSGYDYWGFCDIDIVLGNMDAFLENLSQYDVFSTRREYLSGPLYFFRNTPRINALYRQSADINRILNSSDHFSFTECAKAWGELHAGKNILEIETPVESMTEVIVKAVQSNQINAHFETLALEPELAFKGKIKVEGKNILMHGTSYIHYHHLHNKGRAGYTYPNWHWTEVPESYQITNGGVFGDYRSLQPWYRLSQMCARWKKRFRKKCMTAPLVKHDPYATKLT